MTEAIEHECWKLVKYPYGIIDLQYIHFTQYADFLGDSPLIFRDTGTAGYYYTLEELKDVAEIDMGFALELFQLMSHGDLCIGYRGYLFKFTLPPFDNKPFRLECRNSFVKGAYMLGNMLTEFNCRKVIVVRLIGTDNAIPLRTRIASGNAWIRLLNSKRIKIDDFPLPQKLTRNNIAFGVSAQLTVLRDFQVTFIVGGDAQESAIARAVKSALYEPRLLGVIMGFVLTKLEPEN